MDPESLRAVLTATNGVLSHQSAASLYGVPLPPWLDLTSLFRPGQEVHATDRPDDRYPADLGHREWRIALQYDGRHHGMPDQQESDVRRDEWFRRHGWLVIVITVQDLHDDLRSVIGQIRARVARLGAG